MEIIRSVARFAQDADVEQAGYQAHPLYILMNIGVPLAVGMLISMSRQAAEYIANNGNKTGSTGAAE